MGRLIVELKLAPSRPLAFLLVRLVNRADAASRSSTLMPVADDTVSTRSRAFNFSVELRIKDVTAARLQRRLRRVRRPRDDDGGQDDQGGRQQRAGPPRRRRRRLRHADAQARHDGDLRPLGLVREGGRRPEPPRRRRGRAAGARRRDRAGPLHSAALPAGEAQGTAAERQGRRGRDRGAAARVRVTLAKAPQEAPMPEPANLECRARGSPAQAPTPPERRLERERLVGELQLLDRDRAVLRVERRRLQLHRQAALQDEARAARRAVGRQQHDLAVGAELGSSTDLATQSQVEGRVMPRLSVSVP